MIGKYSKSKTVHCNLIGIYTASAYIPGTVIIIHAPRSCSHIVHSATAALKERYLRSEQTLPYCSDNLFVTGMDDNDAIFGGEARLEACLRDVIAVKQPAYVMVAGGCVAGVIGDDIESVCKKVEKDTGTVIFNVTGAGFMTDEENDPYIMTTELLFERFLTMEPHKCERDSVVVLGELSVNNKKQVMDYIRSFFGYFGFKNVFFPIGGMEIKDFAKLNQVGLAVAGKGQLNRKKKIHAYTQSFAEKMDIPYMLEDLPETPGEIVAYVKAVAEKIGKPELAKEILAKENALLEEEKQRCANLQGKHCVMSYIFSYNYAMPKKLIETVRTAGIEIDAFLLLPEMSDIEKKRYKQALADYNIPFLTEAEYLAQPRTEDFVISSSEKPYFAKEFLTSTKHVGARGICAFWHKLSEFVASDRRMTYED